LTIRGRAIDAIRIATFSSCAGGVISALALLFISPPAAKIALLFQPTEYFLLAILGLTCIASVSFKSFFKGLISGFFGVFLSTIGVDIKSAYPRFTLEGGIGIIPAVIGLFAFAQALAVSRGEADKTILLSGEKNKLSWNLWPRFSEIVQLKGTLIRAWIIGLIVGIIPAAGASIAQWIAYSEEIRRAKPGDQFGKGEIKGLAACEAANNATTGATLIPLFILGIPGGIAAALIFGALIIHGLNPGIRLFTETPQIVYPVMWGFLIANILMGFIAVVIARSMAYLTQFPRGILSPLIIVFCVMGVYATSHNIYDLFIMYVFGVLGYLMNRYDFVPAATLLGLILGPICEDGFRDWLKVSQGSPISYLLARPLSLVIIALIFLAIYFSFQHKIRQKKGDGQQSLSSTH
jgi:putative tricarboxylic transport membrane protein